VMMLFIFRTRLNKSSKKDENETDMFENKKHGMSAWRRLHMPSQTVIDLIVGRNQQENKDFFGEKNLSAMFRDLDTDSDGLISKVCMCV
jgi:hypothetical protein